MADSARYPERLPQVYAILQGGGVKGSALVGALNIALDYVKIIGIGGTSAGAIVAALFAAGYSPKEIHMLMLQINYRSFARRLWWPRRFGIHSSDGIYSWIRNLLSMKLKNEADRLVCFCELPLPLKIVAADIRNQETMVFSRESFPQMEVATAVRMSMSIPFFYEMITDGARQFVDGGVISNFPLWLFDEERLSSASGIPLLGFELQEVKAVPHPIRSWRQYALGVINAALSGHEQLLQGVRHLNGHPNIISIPTGAVSATDFGISSKTVEWLYQQGVGSARTFFSTQAVGTPQPAPRPTSLDIASISDSLKVGTMEPREALLNICYKHLYRGGLAWNAGTFSPIMIRWYVDLMEAALDAETLEVLAQCMTGLIEHSNPGAFDVVAGIKVGNPILASAVARRLRKRCVLVKNIYTPKGGYPFDGAIGPGVSAILVDDVSSDGVFLRNAVRALRAQGVLLRGVFTLVDRKEGRTQAALCEDGVSLTSLLSVDDSDFAPAV